MSTPTQVEYPRRATIRSGFQAFVGLCGIVPAIVAAALFGVDTSTAPGWLVGTLALIVGVAMGVTRVMALPPVNTWIATHVPWLAAEPKPTVDAAAIITRSTGGEH